MTAKIRIALLCLLFILAFATSRAQERKWEDIDTTGFYKKQVVKHGKYELTFIDKAPDFDTVTGKRLIGLFFKVYPEEVKRFNTDAPRRVTFVITPDFNGVAGTIGAVIKFNPSWFAKNPEDIDCATHELMHVVQAYKGGNKPWWLVEGIADYGRDAFGINNKNANWALTTYHKGQNYDNGYRVTARFLLWAEKHYNKDLVKKLDNALRKEQFNDDLWLKLTGKTVDELWYLYMVDPVIS